jgi:hypothetical protein
MSNNNDKATEKLDMRVNWGPCCFCGNPIEPTNIDPCSVKVTTTSEKWQVWFCHSQCFKDRVVSTDEIDLSPAHF